MRVPLFSAHDLITMVARTKQTPRAPVDLNAPMDIAYQTEDFLMAQKATLNVLERYLSIDVCDTKSAYGVQ